MLINLTIPSDASLVHDLMIRAFMEYKEVIPPSSALEETVQLGARSRAENRRNHQGNHKAIADKGERNNEKVHTLRS